VKYGGHQVGVSGVLVAVPGTQLGVKVMSTATRRNQGTAEELPQQDIAVDRIVGLRGKVVPDSGLAPPIHKGEGDSKCGIGQ
jgi:hypothetical protein